MSAPLVLLTDFGLRDHYVGSVKGVILSVDPRARVVDLSHGIEAQNIVQAAALLESSYFCFPKGSVFVCVVDPGVGTKRKIICVKTSRYYFFAPDNGLLASTLEHEKQVAIRSVENQKFFWKQIPSSTFHGRDIISPAAAHLARSNQPSKIFSQLGPKLSRIQHLALPRAFKLKRGVRGEIVYFDHFGNAATNLHRQDQTDDFWKKAEVEVKGIPCGKILATYGQARHGLIALFDSADRIEIAVPRGSAREECSLTVGDEVKVTL